MEVEFKNLIDKISKHLHCKPDFKRVSTIIDKTLNKITNYYIKLDYSKLSKDEFRLFENTVLYHNFIHDLCYYTIFNVRFSEIAIIEEKKEFYLDLKEKKENLEEQICDLVNKWIITRISYKLDLNSYDYTEDYSQNVSCNYVNFSNLIRIRKTLELFKKVGVLLNYSPVDELEEYKSLYKRCNHNIMKTVILTKQLEQDLLLESSKKITNNIIK